MCSAALERRVVVGRYGVFIFVHFIPERDHFPSNAISLKIHSFQCQDYVYYPLGIDAYKSTARQL